MTAPDAVRTRSDDTSSTGGRSGRVTIGLALVGVAAAALALGVVLTVTDDDSTAEAPTDAATTPSLSTLPASDDVATIVFQNTAVGADYGMVAAVAADAPDDERRTSGLRCQRIDVRGGRGLCVRSNQGAEVTHEAVFVDADLVEGYRVGLLGPPSRARLSPSGSMAAVTSFVTGHEYASEEFSTQTILIDVVAERVIADLEVDFVVERNGAEWREVDFNFWGVTFADDDRFYATLGTGGVRYLVEGETSTRTMRVIHTNGQCPAVSPDGARLAYRTQVAPEGQPQEWRLAVLDLATSEVTLLAEERTVDDQPSWIGNDTVSYGLADPESPAEPDTWTLPADGTGAPEQLLASSWSATVVDP